MRRRLNLFVKSDQLSLNAVVKLLQNVIVKIGELTIEWDYYQLRVEAVFYPGRFGGKNFLAPLPHPKEIFPVLNNEKPNKLATDLAASLKV